MKKELKRTEDTKIPAAGAKKEHIGHIQDQGSGKAGIYFRFSGPYIVNCRGKGKITPLQETLMVSRLTPEPSPEEVVASAAYATSSDLDKQFQFGLQVLPDGLAARLKSPEAAAKK